MTVSEEVDLILRRVLEEFEMKSILSVLFWLRLLGLVQSDHCELDGRISQPGEKYPIPDDCGEYTCHENGFLSTLPCPYFVSGSPFCELVPVDLTKPYPQCCERYACQ